MKNEKVPQIAVIDFGSQYTHLITRRIRQLGVLAKIYLPTVELDELKGIKGLILSGGPNSVYDNTAVLYNKKLLSLPVPILGLCYGHQLLAQHFGGQVKPGKTKEYGFAEFEVLNKCNLILNLPKKSKIWMSHGDSVAVLPDGFVSLGKTGDCAVAAMADEKRKIYGLQFHPEVVHSEYGGTILKNFVFNIAKAKKDWSLDSYFQEIIDETKKIAGDKKVFLLVSGGVDSSVCFALLEKILGKEKVFGLHIDSGAMRQGETKKVKAALAKAGFDNLHIVDASEEFLKNLNGVFDPEKKREIIGKTFLEIKDAIMKDLKLKKSDWLLGQGTIYPDTIESGATKHADKIKTHHNRVAEILKLQKIGALIEPIAGLYKDEVRQVGKKLGLPANLINRHPFPGPGLFIRVLCSQGNKGNAIKKNEMDKIKKIVDLKYQTVVLPLKSVGVQGDNRTYRHPILLSGLLDFKKLHDLSVRLTNEIKIINRAVYLVAPQKIDLKKIKLKKAEITKDRLDLLRQADEVVNRQINSNKLYKKIWQFPVVLAPLTLSGGEAIILRPVESKEAMTVNFYQMEKNILNQIAKDLLKIKGIDLVLYDITNKPPGTIEWE